MSCPCRPLWFMDSRTYRALACSDAAGAISVLDLSMTTFDSNTAGTAGGALQNSNCNLQLDNISVTDNTAMFGGGLHLSGSELTSNISGMWSGNTAGKDGGAVWCDHALVVGGNTVITHNRALSGSVLSAVLAALRRLTGRMQVAVAVSTGQETPNPLSVRTCS